MKKEILKEKCTAAAKKVKETLKEHKKQAVLAAMSMAALAVLIYASAVFYKSAVTAKNPPEEVSSVSASSVIREKPEEKKADETRRDDPERQKQDKKKESKSMEAEARKTGTKENAEPEGVSYAEDQEGSEDMAASAKDSAASAAPSMQPPVQEETQVSYPAAAPGPEEYVPAASSAESPTENAHEHDWIPVTVSIHHDAVTHTVHHDAETQTVHHDAVTREEPVYEFRTICNTCGADITGHIPDHIGPVCQGSYSAQQVQTGVNIVTDAEAYDEEVVIKEAWDETVTDQEAYDDVVTTGYRCSICGATK